MLLKTCPWLFVSRALVVQREQEKLRKNLIKYNNFVREKHAKVEEGNRVYQEEISYQNVIERLIKDKQEQVQTLEKAKV